MRFPFTCIACLLPLLVTALIPRLLPAESKPGQAAVSRLEWIRQNEPGMWNVAPSEGQFLYDEVLKVKAAQALEVGTSNGYSGIWIASALRQTGGHLWTCEIDKGRAKLAHENFQKAGVESLITLRLGDATEIIPKLDGSFQFVFLDAAKSEYVQYLDQVLEKTAVGGVIIAHNVTDLRASLEDFIKRVKTDPRLKTTFVNAGPGGFSVSTKVR